MESAGEEKIISILLDMKGEMSNLGNRIGALENRMTGLESRMITIEGKLVRIDERLERVEERLERVEERLDKLEERVAKLEERFDKLEGRVDNIESDIAIIKKDIKDMNERMNRNFGLLVDMQTDTSDKLDNMSDKLIEVDFKIGVLEAGVGLNADKIRELSNIR